MYMMFSSRPYRHRSRLKVLNPMRGKALKAERPYPMEPNHRCTYVAYSLVV